MKIRTHINWSAGKDSTAMLLRMIELKEPIHKITFADTLLEFPQMYDYVDMIKSYFPIPLTMTVPDNDFLRWFFGVFTRGSRKGNIRGFPFVCSPCWYQREAKVKPMERENKDADVVCIGYAKGEEKRNMKDSKFRYPLQEWGWTEKDCKKYLEERGLLNPLYKYFDRLGCFCCPKQPKRNWYIIYKLNRTLFNFSLMLESLSPQGSNPNYSLKDIKKEIETTGGVFTPNGDVELS